MAERKPIVVIDGSLQELPSGDTVTGIPPASGEVSKADLDEVSVAMAIALG